MERFAKWTNEENFYKEEDIDRVEEICRVKYRNMALTIKKSLLA